MKKSNDASFVYDDKDLTPVENYDKFQKSIAMSKGVCFFESRDILNQPVLFMYHLPGLPLNLDDIRTTYSLFNKNLLNHVSSIVNTSDDAFYIYSSVYDIYTRVRKDLNALYATKAFPFIGKTTNKSLKEIKQMGIVPIKGRFRELAAPEWNQQVLKPVMYDQLGTELKEFITRVFELWLSYNKKLLARLEPLVTGLFEDNRKRHIRYEGDIADIVEIAIAIVASKNLKVFGKRKLTLNSFTRQLAAFLGISLNDVSSHRITLQYRFSNRKSFLSSSVKNVEDFVQHLP